MNQVLIIGAGRIGHCISKLLARSGRFHVTLADQNESALSRLSGGNIATLPLNVYDQSALHEALQNKQAVISACSFNENPHIAEAALISGASYFDLTEDVETTRHIQKLAKKARPGQIFMPQCGLAPGFIGILGHALGQRFEKLDTLKLRVGALPEFPSNRMMYNLTWSTEGLINEYCNPCEAIKQGQYVEVEALEGLESFSLDGIDYEAFNTSGGLGTLCQTLKGQVQELTYKTIRYPGHRYLMDFLVNGLRLGDSAERRNLLKQIFESSIAVTQQDVVIVFVSANGWIEGQLTQISDYFRIYHDDVEGEHWSAIQISTATGIASVVDLFFTGKLPSQGFVSQEQVRLSDFMGSEFAQAYRESRHHRRNQFQNRTP
ncbi:MAG: saccharopine dehydrogenase NADP-binding domain-containing protein [Hahellaceae bacterium]|nr:saccharopine dehydrogenase NADP-binding domain-containing protein [Hahellaceae bacterium]